MKTIEAFIEEVEGSAALQEELGAVKDEGTLAELLRMHDVEGTVEELANAVRAKAESEGEIDDDDAEAVAGGAWNPFPGYTLMTEFYKSIGLM